MFEFKLDVSIARERLCSNAFFITLNWNYLPKSLLLRLLTSSSSSSSVVNEQNGQNWFRPKPKFRPSWPKVRPKFRPKIYQKLRENNGVFLYENFSQSALTSKSNSNYFCYHFINFIWILVDKKESLWKEFQKIKKKLSKISLKFAKNSSKWRFSPFRYFGGLTERFGRNISADLTEISAEISVSVVH